MSTRGSRATTPKLGAGCKIAWVGELIRTRLRGDSPEKPRLGVFSADMCGVRSGDSIALLLRPRAPVSKATLSAKLSNQEPSEGIRTKALTKRVVLRLWRLAVARMAEACFGRRVHVHCGQAVQLCRGVGQKSEAQQDWVGRRLCVPPSGISGDFRLKNCCAGDSP